MTDHRTGREPPDPFAQLQQLITTWERRIDSVANRVMDTDEFSRSMNGLQKAQLVMQKTFMRAMAHQLNNLNMPSRADTQEIGEALVSLEQRIARMEQTLARIERGQGNVSRARSGPPRTKLPPSATRASSAEEASS